MSITVDKEFESLIPPLTSDEYTQLERNIIKEGIRDALIVWKSPDGKEILVDGHNRMKISAAHGGIRFDVKYVEFASRDEAMAWIIRNQFGRRNLSAYDRSVLALKLKPLIAEKAKEKELERKMTFQKSEKSSLPKHDTAKELAKLAGVSHDTVHRVEKIEQEASEETKQQVREGKLSINQAYNSLFPRRVDPIRQAQERHEEFQEKKKEGVVDIREAQADKDNQRIIGLKMTADILKLLNSINDFGMCYKAKQLDNIGNYIDDSEKKNILTQCDSCQIVLQMIKDSIRGGGNGKY